MKPIMAADIRTMAESIWPDIKQIWVTDRQYAEITPDHLVEIAATIPIDLRRVQGEVWDCEDIARHVVDVCRYKAFKFKEKLARAVGTANGLKFAGEFEPHMGCIFAHDKKLWLFEPQTLEYWQPKMPDDMIFKLDF